MNRGRPRLFAIHHAGGSPAAFARLRRAFDSDLDVVAVMLPGRGRSGWVHQYPTLDALAADLAVRLRSYLDIPYLLYGHSMGAMVAHRLALWRAQHDLAQPRCLLLGAVAAPHVAVATGAPVLSDAELARWTARLSPNPDAAERFLAGTGRGGVALGLLREDLRLLDTSRCTDSSEFAQLDCPVEAFVGTRDSLVPSGAADGWRQYTRNTFEVREVSGGHFFFRESPGHFHREIRSAISRYMSPSCEIRADSRLAVGCPPGHNPRLRPVWE